MTVKKATRCGGFAGIVARQRLLNTNQQIDYTSITKPSSPPTFNIIVGFNEKDQLQLLTKEDANKNENDDKSKLLKDYSELKTSKCENIPIDDINNCINVENYPNCDNTLVFYITKNIVREAIALKFENNQDFKRIYFTYKYFKMRNRLTNNTNNYAGTDHLFSKKSFNNTMNSKNRKNSIEEYFDKAKSDFDGSSENDSITHIIHQKHSREPMSLIGIRSDFADTSEIDSIIYTDVDVPAKPERKRLFQRIKTRAPQPPSNKENKVLKGEFVRVNVERSPDIIPKDNRLNKIPDILMFRDGKSKARSSPTRNVWSANNKGEILYQIIFSTLIRS